MSAADGKLLWSFPWKFNVAVAPSPLAIGDDRVFMTSLYNADSVMIRVKREGERVHGREGVQPAVDRVELGGPHADPVTRITCSRSARSSGGCSPASTWTASRSGRVEGKASFGLGSFLLADGMFFVLEGETGMLRLIEANTTEYKELARPRC